MKRAGILLLCLCLLTGCGAQATPVAEYTKEEETTMTVALTFDDGPNPTYTPELLDGLKERGVHATFFLIGSQVEEYPELARRIAEEGHQIGNHTYDHANLQELTEWEAKQDLKKNDGVLQEIIGEGIYWIRPPYGCVGEKEQRCADVPFVKWSVDTEDWKVKDSARIISRVVGKVKDGDVVLMHELYGTTATAVETIVPTLVSQGFQLVTVSELAKFRGYELVPGQIYYSFRAK